MLDHMLFDMKKWFSVNDNADSVKINGKNYATMPSKVFIKSGTKVYTPDGIEHIIYGKYTFTTCGKMKAALSYGEKVEDYYISNDPKIVELAATGSSFVTVFIPVDQASPIWGGKHPLAHIWQALRAFTARKAVSAL